MQVIGHDDEFMQEKFLFFAIVRKRFDQESGCNLAAKNRLPKMSDSRDEEGAFGIHSAMVVGLGESCL